MKFIRYYSHEIFSVLVLILLTWSAVFLTPDFAQKIILVYSFLFLLHEWEENNYPGGFFDMLIGEIARISPMPEPRQLRESRIGVYIPLSLFLFPAFFLHKYLWLVLPIVYLGIFEGLAHTLCIPIFKLNRRYTPGMCTALIQFVTSIYTLVLLAKTDIAGWQWATAVLFFFIGFAIMVNIGMRLNHFKPTEMPKRIIANLKDTWGKN